MLVVTSNNEGSASSPGFASRNCCVPTTTPLENEISLRPIHCVVSFDICEPRCGVAIVMTRRTDVFGSKKNSCVERRAFGDIGFQRQRRRFAHQPPDVVAAVERLQPRDQAPHAVPDQHHLIERHGAMLRIESGANSTKVWRNSAALCQNGCPVGYS